MAVSYPGTIDTFTSPTGSDTLNSPDHAGLHTDHNTGLIAIENVLGTTAGTSVLKDFSAGHFPVRVNSSNVLQQAISGTVTLTSGTLNNMVIGTPAITGGTLTSTVFTTPTLNNATIGTPAITGGTANSMLLGTPTFTANTLTNITARAMVYLGTTIDNLADNTPTKVGLDTETNDPGNNFATSTFTVPVPGVYAVSGRVTFTSVVANKAHRVEIYKNGTAALTNIQHSGLADTLTVQVVGDMSFALNDTVQLYATQISGAGTTDIFNGVNWTSLSIRLVA